MTDFDRYASLGTKWGYVSISHYANMSMQYTEIFHGCKEGNFQVKKCDILLILLKT